MQSVWSSMLFELRVAVCAALPEADAVPFEIPPDAAMGDLAVPCFALAKALKQSPAQIAGRMAEVLHGHPLVARAEVVGGYCNIVLDSAEVSRRVFEGLSHTTPSSSPSKLEGEKQKEEIVLEYISPNANKPLHLGHLRNAFFGEAVGRLLEAAGHRVHRVCLLNDRGIAMAKAMLAYERWGNGATPESEHVKGDHFVGGWYVRFDKENKKTEQRSNGETEQHTPTPLEQEAQELVRKWEAGDEETRALWGRMCDWVIAGHAETLTAIGVRFATTYRESNVYERGRAIAADALARGVFRRDAKGNIIAPLEERGGLDDKVVERADGTTVYATQDLALAEVKAQEFPDARSIVVTMVEQDYYFRQLNAILEMLRMPKVEHLSYEIVLLPEGRMKSRAGTVVDADDLLGELTRLAEEEIRTRADIVPGEPAAGTDEPPIVVSDAALARAQDIALAAIRFYLLHAGPRTVLTFNPKESLAFTGKTGPYLQYMHARMCAIARRAGQLPDPSSQLQGGSTNSLQLAACSWQLLTHPSEKALLLRIARFPDVIADAAAQRDPSHVAQFAYDFAQTFANFYHDCPVLTAETPELRDARLALLARCRETFAHALTLLGIAPLEEM